MEIEAANFRRLKPIKNRTPSCYIITARDLEARLVHAEHEQNKISDVLRAKWASCCVHPPRKWTDDGWRPL